MHSRLAAIATRGVAMAGTFIQVVVISRSVSLDDAGTVFVLFTLMNLAATLGRFGTDNLVLRRIASKQPGHETEARWLKAICWIASGLSGIAIYGLLASGLLQVSGSRSDVLEAACVGLMTVFYAINVFAGAVLRASGRLIAGILAELGSAPWLTAIFVGLASFFWQPTVLTVLLALLAAGALTALWAMVQIRALNTVRGDFDWRGCFIFVRTHLSSLSALMGTSLLFFALVWVPQLGLGLVGTGAQVAQYTAAARIASFISIFPGIQTSYLAPKFAQLSHSGQLKELSAESGRAAMCAALVAVPILTFVALVPQMLLQLFGVGYEEAVVPALILCIGSYVTLAFGQVNTVMLTSDLERPAMLLNSLLLVFVAVLTVVGAPAIGVAGVAIVNAVGSMFYAAISSLIIRVQLGVNSTIGSFFGHLLFPDELRKR